MLPVLSLSLQCACRSTASDPETIREARDVEVSNGQAATADGEEGFEPVDFSDIGQEPDLSEVQIIGVPQEQD